MAIIFNGTNVAQDPLVSGSNIKTINGNSLLGGGNISIVADVSSAAVASATAGIGTGAVGSYAFLYRYRTDTIYPGGTSSGSGLQYVALVAIGQNLNSANTNGSVSGTWRCMGYSLSPFGKTNYVSSTLWLRIA